MSIDTPFTWGASATAGGAAHAPARPTDSQISWGYPEGQPVPAEEFNWLAYMIGRGFTPRFTTLQAAVAGMTDDTGAASESVCTVDESDFASAPLAQVAAVALAGVVSLAVAGDGVVYLRSNGGALECRKLSRDLTTTLATYTLAVAAVAGARVVTDGARVVVYNNLTTRCFDAVAGGSALWSYASVAAVNDLAIDSERVYLASAAGGVIALNRTTGAVVYAYPHGGVVWSVATDGLRLFLAGAASVNPSGATLRAIVAATGADAANEGLLGADATGTAWDYAGNAVTQGGLLATDGRVLYEVTTVGPNFIVELHEPSRGTAPLASDSHAGVAVVSLALDQDWAYFCGDTFGSVVAYGKRDLNPRQWSIQAAFATAVAFVSDGCATFAADAAGIKRYARSNRARIWRRINPSTSRYAPYRWLLIPEEG